MSQGVFKTSGIFGRRCFREYHDADCIDSQFAPLALGNPIFYHSPALAQHMGTRTTSSGDFTRPNLDAVWKGWPQRSTMAGPY
jgi:hypothetical protein